jgi:predicted metal-dependent hydrolase
MDVFNIPLNIIPEDRKTVVAHLINGACEIRIPYHLVKKKKLLIKNVDTAFWRLMAKTELSNLKQRTNILNLYNFNFAYGKVNYHRQFSRWGSCSSLKNINISHRLIGAPQLLSDYVIIHELAHLQYLNHGHQFWNLVKGIVPKPQELRREIKNYGHKWQEQYHLWLLKLYKSL